MSAAAEQTARRRRALALSALGAGLLDASFSAHPGSRTFYGLTFALAGTWTAGAWAARPEEGVRLRPGVIPVAVPVVLGAGAAGAFFGAALIAREIPVLNRALTSVLSYEHRGSSRLVLASTLLNGAAEELFFRGAVYDAVGFPAPVLASTAVYATVTAASRNPALVLASVAMGIVFGMERKLTGGVQAPLLTHLTWSALVLRYLPPLFPPPLRVRARTG